MRFASENELLSHAKKLTGKSLRQVVEPSTLKRIEQHLSSQKNKGRYGQLLSWCHFDLPLDSSPTPDFFCGIELKVTPLKKTNSGYTPKERLVCNIINFETIIHESWESSSFLKKNQRILLIRYVDPMNQSSQLDYVVKDVRIHDLYATPHFERFKADWELIVAKIRAGQADKLSESDTTFLGACTKGANSKSLRPQPNSPNWAMQRAFSFKTAYMKLLTTPVD